MHRAEHLIGSSTHSVLCARTFGCDQDDIRGRGSTHGWVTAHLRPSDPGARHPPHVKAKTADLLLLDAQSGELPRIDDADIDITNGHPAGTPHSDCYGINVGVLELDDDAVPADRVAAVQSLVVTVDRL